MQKYDKDDATPDMFLKVRLEDGCLFLFLYFYEVRVTI